MPDFHADAVSRITPVYGGGRLRLTVRGRRVFGALGAFAVIAVLSLVAAFGAPNAQATDDQSSVTFGYIAVQPGATLWSIATQLDPQADPRDVIAEVVRLNQLSGSEVQSGQVLAVPMKYRDVSGVTVTAESHE